MKRIQITGLFFTFLFLNQAFAQNVGVNTNDPQTEIDVRPADTTGLAEFNVGSFDNSTFLRLFSNQNADPNPGFWWLPGKSLKFNLGNPGTMNNTEFLRLDGKTIGIYNTGESIFIGQNAGTNDDGTDNRNIGIGTEALSQNTWGSGNIAIGLRAFSQNESASGIVAIGDSSLYNSTGGFENTAVGAQSQKNNTSGFYNTALGFKSLSNNKTGWRNVAIGRNALLTALEDDNTAIGHSAMEKTYLGYDNVAVGSGAMFSNSGGFGNVAIGRNALSAHLNGHSNIAIGRNVMLSHMTGDRNIAIGKEALYNNTIGSGNIAIGDGAGYNETSSGKLYIDNSPTSAPLIWGDFTAKLLRTNGKHEVTNDFTVTNNAFFVNRASRQVGIGTISPQSELHVKHSGYSQLTLESSTNNDAIIQLTDNANTTDGQVYQWTIRRDGTDGNMVWQHGGFNKLSMKPSGDLAIGNISTQPGYKLAIDGKILAEGLRVQLSSLWPDYVFNEDYDLMSLKELDISIKKNGHLPGIPKAEVIEKEGLDTGEMHSKMMEKIEELTLYIIELNKQNEELKGRVDQLENHQK